MKLNQSNKSFTTLKKLHVGSLKRVNPKTNVIYDENGQDILGLNVGEEKKRIIT